MYQAEENYGGMDNYNHMMNPEYGNMVYQPGVVNNMPMEGILLQQNNQNNHLQKPDQQQQSQLQQPQQIQQHPPPSQDFIEEQQQQQQQQQKPPSPPMAQNNEQHLEQYTTNSIESNLSADQINYSNPIERTTNEQVISEDVQLPSTQLHNESESVPHHSPEPLQHELESNEPLENHKQVDVTEEQTLIENSSEQNAVQEDSNNLNSNNTYTDALNTNQMEVKEDAENSEQSNNLSEVSNNEQEVKAEESMENDTTLADTKDEPDADDTKPEIPNESTDLIVPDEVEAKQEEEIDEHQCRVCLSKDDLVNVFNYEPKNNLRICDILMKLCTTVKITERDYLPHFVCSDCVEKINIAYELKTQCEETDKTLRSKLTRSKKKSRGTTEFLLIDCVDYSSGSDDEQNKEDDDFHLSEVSMASEVDSDESFGKKRRSARNRSRRNNNRSKSRSKAKSSGKRRSGGSRPAQSPVVSSKRSRNSIVYIEAPDNSDDEDNVALASRARTRNRGTSNRSRKPATKANSDESDDEPVVSRRPGPSSSKKAEYKCNYCAKVYTSQDALRDHKRAHVGEKPSPCPICNKPFKQQISLTAHIQKHKEDDERRCTQCNKQFASKIELKKHLQTAHVEVFTCDKCKRTFTSKPRLDKHKCPGTSAATAAAATSSKRKNDYDYAMNSGRDLFKSVAPLTTTYWSDSFSD